MFKTMVVASDVTVEVSTVCTEDAGWETIMFEQGKSWRACRQWEVQRYEDGKAAFAGHDDVVERVADIIAAHPNGKRFYEVLGQRHGADLEGGQ